MTQPVVNYNGNEPNADLNFVDVEGVFIQPVYAPGDLKTFFESCAEGKDVIKAYLNNTERLSPTVRSRVVRLVIGREIDYLLRDLPPGASAENLEISRERFEQLSNEITSLFAGEYPTTYYRRGRKDGNVYLNPTGKLFDHFNYRRAKLHSNKTVLSRSKRVEENHPFEEVDMTHDEQLVWLQNNVEPWATVRDYWRATYSQRMRILKVENLAAHDYFAQFPCLKIQDSIALIESDFSTQYPGLENLLIDRWPLLKRVITEELKLKVFRNVEERALILSLDSLEPEKQDAVLLHLLPTIITPFAPKRKKQGEAAREKTTIQDRRNQFFFNIPSAADVPTYVERIKDDLRRKKQTFQPTIIGIGELVDLRQFSIHFNDLSYEVDSALKGLDFALKLYHAVDLKYPDASSSLWTFFHKAGWDLQLPSDRNNNSVEVIVGRVRRELAPQNE